VEVQRAEEVEERALLLGRHEVLPVGQALGRVRARAAGLRAGGYAITPARSEAGGAAVRVPSAATTRPGTIREAIGRHYPPARCAARRSR
jgi:hypothetical protein